MKYPLPTIQNNSNGFSQLAKLGRYLEEVSSEIFVLDFSSCSFFPAQMVATLQAIIASKDIKIIGLQNNVEEILRKNKFLVQYGYEPEYDFNQTTLPYQRFRLSENILFFKYLNQYLAGKGIPEMSSDLEHHFKKSICEIFANCAIHSDSSHGVFVCGQYYPRKSKLDITISDAGVGIYHNVSQTHKTKIDSAEQAILWAIEYGNTTKINDQPGGLGLALLQKFVEHNKGKIQIISSNGYYEFNEGQVSTKLLDFSLVGTTVNLEINTRDNNSYCLSSEKESLD